LPDLTYRLPVEAYVVSALSYPLKQSEDMKILGDKK